MTETRIDRPANGAGEEEPRCHVGSATKSPCWRPATEKCRPVDAEPTLCSEHARHGELVEDEDDWRYALDVLKEWIKGVVECGHSDHLRRLAYNMRDEARRGCAAAAVRAHAAELIAQQGPPDEGGFRLTLEQAEELARLILRTDAFSNARAVLEDAPKDFFGLHDRWAIIDALADAGDVANEEARRYKEKIGLLERPERTEG